MPNGNSTKYLGGFIFLDGKLRQIFWGLIFVYFQKPTIVNNNKNLSP